MCDVWGESAHLLQKEDGLMAVWTGNYACIMGDKSVLKNDSCAVKTTLKEIKL